MVTTDPFTELTLALSKTTLAKMNKHREICRCVVSVIPKANRITLWKFNPEKTAIICLVLFENQAFHVPDNLILRQEDFPVYFDAVLKNDVVVASDARSNPDTSCFTEGYFKPNNIHSLLDYVFHDDLSPLGVICCEATDSAVTWSQQDIAALKRVAQTTSIFFTS